jgi:hydroxyacylglutathione hydrolase
MINIRKETSMTTTSLELRHRQVGPWPMNTYALICPTTNASVLFDPGADPDILESMVAGSKPIAILLTHSHGDHVGVLDEMRKRLGVPLMAHTQAAAHGIQSDRTLVDGDSVQVGNHRLHVYYAPGHIDDQICFAIENDPRIIVGDTIFAGGPGRTKSVADFQTTLTTLRTVVLQWPDESVCYPGHGPSFRLGDIRTQVQAFVAQEHGAFYGDAEWPAVGQ